MDAVRPFLIELHLAAKFQKQVAYLIPTESKRVMYGIEHRLRNPKRSCLQGIKPRKKHKRFCFSLKTRKEQIWSLFSRLRQFRMSEIAHTHKTWVSIAHIHCNH